MASNVKYQPDLGDSGWLQILPERVPSKSLDANIEADYCIVGAGFAGLAAARRLLQLDPKASVVILEASQVASGPAGRNSGFMIDLPHVLSSSSYAGQLQSDQQDIRLNRCAIDFVGHMVEDFELPEGSFRTEGKVNGAATRKGELANQDYAKHLDKLGEPYELFDARQMQDITGISYYRGGLATPGTAMIQPAMLVRGIADGLNRFENFALFEQTPVLGLHKQGDRWRIKTPTGSVLASKTILAVNGFIENFGYYQRRLMHINLYASMTRELTTEEINSLGGKTRWGITPSNPFGSTVRYISDRGGHRLVIRNRFSYDPTLEVREHEFDVAAENHRKSFLSRFPMLAKVPMQYRWSGRLCLSRNHVWALGEVADNVISACCQNGLGTTKGVVAGVIAAELANADNTQDSKMPDFKAADLPQKLLPEPFMTIGARSYLKIREWQAGREK